MLFLPREGMLTLPVHFRGRLSAPHVVWVCACPAPKGRVEVGPDSNVLLLLQYKELT